MQDIPRTSIRELAHKIKEYKSPRFTFFLGAGASKQSGIPIASDMIRHFKEQIIARCGPDGSATEEDKMNWLANEAWFKAEGSEYCKCFERFEPKEIGRQRYIESIIENRAPSFGYVVLANLLAVGHINTIITTNFDDLIYSACTTFTGIRPIVYAYGVMASEMRLTAQRPKILKLHGDYLYSVIKNTEGEIAAQDPNMERQLKQVLSEYGLIVLGYGGGDASVMKVISDGISERNDLYWCIRRGEKINEMVEKLLREKRGFLVEIDGFDEMMNEVRRVVEFDVKKMIGSIEERRNQIIEYLKAFEPKYAAGIMGDIVESIKTPDTESVENKQISAIDFAIKGYEAGEAGNFEQAAEFYRQAIEIDPNYAHAYNGLGHALFNLRKFKDAAEAFSRAVEFDPNTAMHYSNLGGALNEVGRYQEAETTLRKAIELDPGYVDAYTNLGSALSSLNRYTEAEAIYRKAIDLDPKYAIAYNGLGIVLDNLQRYSESEAAQHIAISLDPNYADAYSGLGNSLDNQGRHDEAMDAYRKALEIKPTYIDAYRNMGIMLRNLEQHDKAEEAFRKMIELDPDSAKGHMDLSLTLRLLGKEEEALEHAEKAHQIDPDLPDYILAMASIHKKLGHKKETNKYVAEARKRFAADDWYNLACVESVAGNTDAAIENLERAAQENRLNSTWARLDPDLQWVRDDPRFTQVLSKEGV